MLEFYTVKSSLDVRNILKQYDSLSETWIVSDLKSKQEIQIDSIKKHGYYTDESIMRVSDFWQLWIRRLDPTLKIVSSDFIRTLVQSFIDKKTAELDISENESSTLYKCLQEFAPLLLHPASEEVIQEWFIQQTKEKKWQKWYELAKLCMTQIVYENRVIDAKWSAAYLQNLDLNLISWPRKIYVDLGSEMSSVEMGIFTHLAKQGNVVILSPEPEWMDKFPHLLNIFKENYGYGTIKSCYEENSAKTPSSKQFIRLSTQLAEVKFATSKVRGWLDSSVPAENISIVAAEIEKYWPALQFYLDAEGIPYRKDAVSNFNGLGDIQNLLAAIKNYSSEVAWESLEKTFFNKNSDSEFRFEKFKALFYQLYDEDDLAREQKVKKLFYHKKDFNSAVDRDEFLAFLLQIWIEIPESNFKNDLFEPVFKDFLSQSINSKFKFKHWVQFFKNRLSRKEHSFKSSDSGIYILPLMSAQSVNAEYRIYLGLNDEYFHRKQNALIPLSDAAELKNKFDLALDNSEESYLDFNVRWQSLGENENYLFLSSHLSFAGEPLNSSIFFIENNPKSNVVSPGSTRTDELLKNYSLEENISLPRILADKNGQHSRVESEVFKTLTVADVEKYAECSFKLLAHKGFNLSNLPQMAVDLDVRDKGNLAHALFEFCIKQISEKQFDLKKISQFLDDERKKRQLYPLQDEIWGVQKNKFLNLSEKFYQFEKERIKVFEVSTEKSFEMFFDVEKGIFSNTPVGDGFKFNIRIDRIDKHREKKYCIIYDYKSSKSNVNHHSVWLSKNQFQMLLYLTALELNPVDQSKTVGALYYLYKKFDLKNGMIDSVVAESDLGMGKRIGSRIETDEKENLLKNFNDQIKEKLNLLNQFKFAAEPFDKQICNKCDWNKICRAPHLT